MVGVFSTPHLMSIKFYWGLLDFNYVHDRAQCRIENVAARISSRMSWHYLQTFEPWLTEVLRPGSFRESCISLKISSNLTRIKTRDCGSVW